MNDIIFANKEYLWLLVVIAPIIFWYILRNKKSYASINISSLKAFENSSVSYKLWLKHFLFGLKIIALALLIVAFARPQSLESWEERETEGIDIVLALDISGSMLAEDFKPNRMEAAKDIAMEFIATRPNDRIGLVIYAGESFTQCPLTLDHAVLMNLLSKVKPGMVQDGTAIGNGIATAVNRLKDSDAESKVIILLTDGVNNRGIISPLAAAEIAKSYGIRIYSVGIGSEGQAPYPFQTPRGVHYQMVDVVIDEDLMIEVAELTGGRYFRAIDEDELREIYSEIDSLEAGKLEVTVHTRPKEMFFWLLIGAIALLGIDKLIGLTVLRNPV